jgi:hypothetical protein
MQSSGLSTAVAKVIARPFQRFFRMEAAGGLLLLAAAVAAMA